jgi:hypothetical protein
MKMCHKDQQSTRGRGIRHAETVAGSLQPLAKRSRARHQTEAGQSLIEFALVVPVLFVMLLGVIFIARGFNLQMVLHGAAYEGARMWASNPSIGSNNYCTPPACNPDLGNAINFERYIVPVVRQYVDNNGFDGSKVQFFSKDARAYQNALSLLSNDRQLVRLTLLYTI